MLLKPITNFQSSDQKYTATFFSNQVYGTSKHSMNSYTAELDWLFIHQLRPASRQWTKQLELTIGVICCKPVLPDYSVIRHIFSCTIYILIFTGN